MQDTNSKFHEITWHTKTLLLTTVWSWCAIREFSDRVLQWWTQSWDQMENGWTQMILVGCCSQILTSLISFLHIWKLGFVVHQNFSKKYCYIRNTPNHVLKCVLKGSATIMQHIMRFCFLGWGGNHLKNWFQWCALNWIYLFIGVCTICF
jgi:hypothetical protein